MNKLYTKIGFADSEETAPGVWMPKIIEYPYYAEVSRNIRKFYSRSDEVNDDLDINNEISIIGDAYARANFHLIRYAEYMGTLWKVTSVEVREPRLVLSLGGVWNGEETNGISSETV